MKYRIVLLLLAVGMLFSLAACAQPAAQPAAPAEEAPAEEAAPAEEEPMAEEPAEERVFSLGVLGPFSGPSARTGEEFRCSTEMAFDAIDYQIGDYTIELVWIDSQSDPAKASQAYEQAVVQDGIQAGILNWHSSVSVSVMEVTAKHQIPHIFGFGATEVVNETFESDPETYGYWAMKGWPTPRKLSANYVTAVNDAIDAGTWEPPNKQAAIYGEDTDWGRSFGGAIKGQLQDAGWEIVAEEYFPIEQTEFVPLLNTFKDLNPALVAGTSTAAPSFSAFIKQAEEVGLESLIVADGLGWVGEWYELTGEASDGVVDQIPGWTTEEAQAFAADFQERCGIEPSPSSGGLSYDGANMFIQMAQQVYEDTGELNSDTIYQFIQDQVWTGEWSYTDGVVMDEYKYTMETRPDPVVGKGFYTFPVLQYAGGEGYVVWPEDWAVQNLQAPASFE